MGVNMAMLIVIIANIYLCPGEESFINLICLQGERGGLQTCRGHSIITR